MTIPAISPDDEELLPSDALLLRYMSFAKFVAMLSRRALHLCRLDALGEKDRFEGSLPRGQREKIIRELTESLQNNPPPELVAARERMQRDGRAVEWHAQAQVRAYTLALRRSAYVSCWSQGPESEAMWRLYCEGNEGVAMVTTYDKLRALLEDPNLLISPVRYIDSRRDRLPGLDYIHQRPVHFQPLASRHQSPPFCVCWTSTSDVSGMSCAAETKSFSP